MQALHFLFSPSGRLVPRTFAAAVIVVYAAGAASQLLTVPGVIARGGLWPFAAAQALLTWVWFALHARRLHDAGRSAGLAAGAGLLYALSIVLLLIVATGFFKTPTGGLDASTTGTLSLILLVLIVTALAQTPGVDFGWFVVTILLALAFLPVIVAIAVTLWAATRPSVAVGKA